MTDLVEPTVTVVDPVTGRMQGATRRYVKRWSELGGLYRDEEAWRAIAAARGDDLSYEVYDHTPSQAAGDLIHGTSILYPGRVGREFAMTRGHIHARSDRPEIYYCQSGEGLMLMESAAGEVRIAAFHPQAIVYVPPYWIHRSVNTGSTALVTVFCYPADAGQDYDIIARAGGMRETIVEDGAGGWTTEPNPGWRPRSAEEMARYSPAAR